MESFTIFTINNNHLINTEFDLFLLSPIKNKGVLLSRTTILDAVCDLDIYVKKRVVDVNVKVLRKKFKAPRILMDIFLLNFSKNHYAFL
ncbi:MAG: winged helix-turn-helix domain-containing protein [Candidatus Izimaplasma sp.]|nr:winged helix-turn-helix domain-containing protein [Candidatus Izimaplasma bacterium]